MIVPDLESLKQIFERELEKTIRRPYLGNEFRSARLDKSLLYALRPPAKRLRPLLVLLMALAHRQRISPSRAIALAMPAALAVEYIHTYSLVHDDLPAMDDDDFRRGRLSTHRQFDEGLAILTGDALLADAFLLVLSSKNNPVGIGRELALMAGSRGLAAGQSEDLHQRDLADNDGKFAINQAKTARLFASCAVSGALAVNADKNNLSLAGRFGQYFGIAFQMQDDLDDQGHSRFAADMCIESLRHAHDVCLSIPHNDGLLALLHLTFASFALVSVNMVARI